MTREELFKAYPDRLGMAEMCYSNSHNGYQMNEDQKYVLATCLEAIQTEFDLSAPQDETKGLKTLCMYLTGIAMPNLVAWDLVSVCPYSNTYIPYAKIDCADGEVKMQNGTLIAPMTEDSLGWVLPEKVMKTKSVKSASKLFEGMTNTEDSFMWWDGFSEIIRSEMDNDIIKLLSKAIKNDGCFTRDLRQSKLDKNAAIPAIIDEAIVATFGKCGKIITPHILISPTLIRAFSTISCFVPAARYTPDSPSFYGALDGVKTYIAPSLNQDEFMIVLNKEDGLTAPAMFIPYKPYKVAYGKVKNDVVSKKLVSEYGFEMTNENMLMRGKIII